MDEYPPKYSRELNSYLPNNIKIKSYSGEETIVESKIKRLELPDESKTKLKKKDKPNSKLLAHNAQITVLYETSTTEFKENYWLDPFTLKELVNDDSRLFGSVLGTVGVEWDNLPDLIGKSVLLKPSDTGKRTELYDSEPPLSYLSLMDINVEQIESPSIDNQLTDLIITQSKNRAESQATVSKIETSKGLAVVEFELPYGGEKFIQKFSLNEKVQEKRNIFEDIKPAIFREDLDTDSYTFWDFCKHSLGYIPEKTEYNDIIGHPVKIEYTLSGWCVSDPNVPRFY